MGMVSPKLGRGETDSKTLAASVSRYKRERANLRKGVRELTQPGLSKA
jgi:hypothetical protein